MKILVPQIKQISFKALIKTLKEADFTINNNGRKYYTTP